MAPIICEGCGKRLPSQSVTESEYCSLQNQYYFFEFLEEHRMLLRIKDFYRRNPNAEGRIKPHFSRVLASKDHKVWDALCEGVPFDEIHLPPDAPIPLENTREGDDEIIKYLSNSVFELRARFDFVVGEVELLRHSAGVVRCPSCNDRLRLDPSNWGNPISLESRAQHILDLNEASRLCPRLSSGSVASMVV